MPKRRFSSRGKNAARFRANRDDSCAWCWRIGPRTAMQTDDTAGRVRLPRRVGDARREVRADDPRRADAGTPGPAGHPDTHAGRVQTSSSVPRRRAPSGTLRDRSMSGGQTSVARERAERENLALAGAHDPRQGAPRGGGHRAQAGQRRCGDATEVGAGGCIRASGVLRKRERALDHARARDDDARARHDARRRVLELEAENEVLSEDTRLASLLRQTQRRVNTSERRRVLRRTYTGADDEATLVPRRETGFRTASSAVVARLAPSWRSGRNTRSSRKCSLVATTTKR